MKTPYNKKDELDYLENDSQGIESCDCQGICTCEPGLEIDEEDQECTNCDCDDDDDDDDDEIEDAFL